LGAGDSSYPPDVHILRDLGFATDRDGRGSTTSLRATPWLCGANGALRAGPLAMLCDLAGGEGAIRAVHPEWQADPGGSARGAGERGAFTSWVATSDLVLHALRPVPDGVVLARSALLRRTRQTVVIEVTLTGEAAPAEPVGLATLTFAVLPGRSDVQRMGTGADEPRTEFARPGSGLVAPLPEALGVRVADAAAGQLEMAVTPYVGNSLGALQGGVVAMLVELAAEAAGAAALGRAVAVLDLAINYLGLLRAGPARTRARVLRRDAGEALLRVELRDAGGDERLCSVATVLVRA